MNKGYKNIFPYADEQGNQPVIDWLEKLDKQIRNRITSRFSRLETGNYGDYKSVGDGVSELRYDFGAGYRIYFGEDGDRIIVLLIGGDKKTQKRDIEKAKYYWKDYQERKAGVKL